MGIIVLVLLLALILGGLGFALHVLWWIALVVLVIWLIGFVVRVGEGHIARPLVPLIAGQPVTSTAEWARRAVRSWQHTTALSISGNPADVESVTVRYLMYVLLPAWFVPGAADYLVHRRTRIERTSGLGESAIHALVMAEISVPLLLTLLCEVNPLLLAINAATAGVHEPTAIWDVRTAVDGGREVCAAEQHIYSFLESLPFMPISALLCLYWDQVASVWQGRRGRRLDRGAVRGGNVALRHSQESLGNAAARRSRAAIPARGSGAGGTGPVSATWARMRR